MAARQMRWMLALELLAYLVLAWWLGGRGWTLMQQLLLVLGLFLGNRCLIVGVSYLFFWRFATTEGKRSSSGQMLRMMLEEFGGLLLLFVVIMPFERYWLGPDRLARAGQGRMPVLLIHGYQCNRGFWYWIKPRLEAAGWMVATHSLEPVLASIDSYAEGVERRIDEVLAATAGKQVIIVGHSMGGLVARAYLRRFGNSKVARIITLGSPHHGSRLAVLGWGPNACQMKVGNPWLADLDKPEAVPLPNGSVSIFSLDDNQVMPQRACSELSGAENRAISGVSHLGMAFSPLVLETLVAALKDQK